MFKSDATEAVPIVEVTLDALLSWTPTRGRPGAELRAQVGRVKANVETLLQNDIIAEPLIECYELARQGGITLQQIEQVRKVAAAQSAQSVGAILTKHTLIELALMIEGKIIAVTEFVSREDVDKVRELINAAFGAMEEEVADAMDAMMFRALVGLHAAISFFLYDTARPLPRMLHFRFGLPLPTVVMAHRLYADAGRADELRKENKVINPVFMRPFGRALSQ